MESRTVLADATDTAVTGPALGPRLFVEAVLHAYTSWLEREIVNGPVGQRIKADHTSRRGLDPDAVARLAPPSRVIVAGALPPVIEDEHLYRIPDKYVDRMEDQLNQAHERFQRSTSASRPARPEPDISTDLARLTLAPPLRASSRSSSSSSRTSSRPDSTDTSATSTSSPNAKPTISTLLAFRPPLCTLLMRIEMTDYFNTGLRAFVALHPDILAYSDITPAMLSLDRSKHPATSWDDDTSGRAVDRDYWACRDPTNVHPLWERTLPLWLDELEWLGVPTEGWGEAVDPEETFREYEVDKLRRMEVRAKEGREKVQTAG